MSDQGLSNYVTPPAIVSAKMDGGELVLTRSNGFVERVSVSNSLDRCICDGSTASVPGSWDHNPMNLTEASWLSDGPGLIGDSFEIEDNGVLCKERSLVSVTIDAIVIDNAFTGKFEAAAAFPNGLFVAATGRCDGTDIHFVHAIASATGWVNANETIYFSARHQHSGNLVIPSTVIVQRLD